MTPEVRVMFAIAERLHQPVSVIERMSAREVQGWVDYFASARAAQAEGDDALDLQGLSPAQRRAMFPGA